MMSGRDKLVGVDFGFLRCTKMFDHQHLGDGSQQSTERRHLMLQRCGRKMTSASLRPGFVVLGGIIEVTISETEQ